MLESDPDAMAFVDHLPYLSLSYICIHGIIIRRDDLNSSQFCVLKACRFIINISVILIELTQYMAIAPFHFSILSKTWLVEFWLVISSLPDDQAKYMGEGVFAQSLTGNTYSCLPLDLWIEMTMNKGSN